MHRRHFLRSTTQTGLGLGLYSYLGYQIFGADSAQAGIKVYRDLTMTCGVGTTKNFLAEYLVAGIDVSIAPQSSP